MRKATGESPYKDGKVKLPKGANPKDLKGLREIYCKLYSKCLDYATSQCWKNFTCKECHGPYKKQQRDILSLQRRDYDAREGSNLIRGMLPERQKISEMNSLTLPFRVPHFAK